MKYFKVSMIFIIILILLSIIACSDSKVIEGVEYDTYGLLNKKDKKNDNIQYEVCWGNVIAPIYFFGFDMFEPVGKVVQIKGQVPGTQIDSTQIKK